MISKSLNIGWNLLGIEDKSMFDEISIDYVFTYQDAKWSFYSNIIESNEYESISDIEKNQAYWVFANNDFILKYQTTQDMLDIDSLNSGWSLVSSAKITDLNSKFLNSDIKSIWRWEDDNWSFYSPQAQLTKKAIDSGFNSIDKIDDFDGFWIYK